MAGRQRCQASPSEPASRCLARANASTPGRSARNRQSGTPPSPFLSLPLHKRSPIVTRSLQPREISPGVTWKKTRHLAVLAMRIALGLMETPCYMGGAASSSGMVASTLRHVGNVGWAAGGGPARLSIAGKFNQSCCRPVPRF